MPLTRGGSAEELRQQNAELKRKQDEFKRLEEELKGRMKACTQRERELEGLIEQQQQQLQQQQQQQLQQQTSVQTCNSRLSPVEENNFNSTMLSQLVNLTANNVEKSPTIKLPKMLPNEPELWFMQIESIFESQNIIDEDAKTRALVSNANAEVLSCVKHIIMANPKPSDSYSQLKAAIVSHFSVSDESRMYQLIRGEVLTNGKPSQILSRLRGLNSANISEDVLKAIFLTKLPKQHQLVLTSLGNTTLNEIAKKADQMSEIDVDTNPNKSSGSEATSGNDADNKIETLTSEVVSLKAKFENSDKKETQNSNRRSSRGYFGRGRGGLNRGFRGFSGRYRGNSLSRDNWNRRFNGFSNRRGRGYRNKNFRDNNCRSVDHCWQRQSQCEHEHRNGSEGRERQSMGNDCTDKFI